MSKWQSSALQQVDQCPNGYTRRALVHARHVLPRLRALREDAENYARALNYWAEKLQAEIRKQERPQVPKQLPEDFSLYQCVRNVS